MNTVTLHLSLCIYALLNYIYLNVYQLFFLLYVQKLRVNCQTIVTGEVVGVAGKSVVYIPYGWGDIYVENTLFDAFYLCSYKVIRIRIRIRITD